MKSAIEKRADELRQLAATVGKPKPTGLAPVRADSLTKVIRNKQEAIVFMRPTTYN